MAEATLSGATHPILENDYASEWMGIEVLALSDGHATIRMTLRQEMLNGFGMAHGGMIFAFGDTAFALACNPAVQAPGEENSITVASGVDINFLKPAFRGQVLTAVADRRSSAGRSGTTFFRRPRSSGLLRINTDPSRSTSACRYSSVVAIDRCRRRSCTWRMSTPSCSRWVATL